MQLTFQILSAFILIIAILQKEKWKMMLLYTINSILLGIMFLAFGRVTAAIIDFIGAIRMAIYMIYALKKLKPNLIWLITFELGFVASTILTWQDALDLMPMFAMLSSGFGSWQDNQYVLRISFIINGILYIIYEAIIGAYISMSVESINLIFTIISLIYYCILKIDVSIIDKIFKRKTAIEKINNSEIKIGDFENGNRKID